MMAEISELPPVTRPMTLIGIAITGVLVSALFGGITNAFNDWVSPNYFVVVMQWDGIDDTGLASVAQGILEGIIFGVIFSLLFTVATGLITLASCSFGFAFRHMLWILLGVFGCWVVGGLLAMGLATLSPKLYRGLFIGVPREFGPMLGYAWVGGSIVGAQLGGFVSVLMGLVILRANWLRSGKCNPNPERERAGLPGFEGDVRRTPLR